MKYFVRHFSDLWNVIRKDNSKLEASPFFFWFFLPVIVGSTITNWFDLRLFLGTIAWVLLSYTLGIAIIRIAHKRKNFHKDVKDFYST